MKAYLRLTVKELEKAEKVLREAGIFFEGNIDIYSEIAKTAINNYLDDFDENLQKLRKERFRQANFFHLREELEEAVLKSILSEKSGFFTDTERIEREMNALVDSDDFLAPYRTEVDEN